MRCTEPVTAPATNQPSPPCNQGTQGWCKSQRQDCEVTHCRISVTSATDLQALALLWSLYGGNHQDATTVTNKVRR